MTNSTRVGKVVQETIPEIILGYVPLLRAAVEEAAFTGTIKVCKTSGVGRETL